MPDPIADYCAQVAAGLRLPAAQRAAALADLDAALAEYAATLGPDQAIASLGPAADYAAAVNEQLGADRRFETILGMPNALRSGFGRRLAGAFDPADPRLLVPRVAGLGWTVNLGAVAVRLGLLNPDDIDDQVVDAAVRRPWPRLVALAAPVAGLALASRAAGRGSRSDQVMSGLLALGALGLA